MAGLKNTFFVTLREAEGRQGQLGLRLLRVTPPPWPARLPAVNGQESLTRSLEPGDPEKARVQESLLLWRWKLRPLRVLCRE